MKIVNFGSLNIDKTYQVSHFVQPGETLLAGGYQCSTGGKGLNQSIAAARAGAQVVHAGAVGPDGDMLLEALSGSGVDVTHIMACQTATGHAVIQVDPTGQNCILVLGGANRELTQEYVEHILSICGSKDIILLQNEISLVPFILEQAYSRGLKIAFNPSPVDEALLSFPLEHVHWLILNEVEGAQLTGRKGAQDQEILQALRDKYPKTEIILTVGERGALYAGREGVQTCPACKAPVVDTTGAGDTFCGYFFAGILRGERVETCLETASKAASIAISRPGASISIPWMKEVVNGPA